MRFEIKREGEEEEKKAILSQSRFWQFFYTNVIRNETNSLKSSRERIEQEQEAAYKENV